MMRAIGMSALLILGLAAAPAFAQSQSHGAAIPDTSSSAQASGQNAQGPQGQMQTRQELQQSLQQAGFKDIHITAQSFVVHAKGPDGSPVVMMITPDQVTGVVESSAGGPGSAPNANGNHASMHGENSNGMNGENGGASNGNNSGNQ